MLRYRSILHTDSAKAYRKVGPLKWPAPGALHEEFEVVEACRRWQYGHTNVTHKRKPGQPIVYVSERTLTLPNGEVLRTLGGTEKVDGYWATLRREVGRKAVNTGEQDSQNREWLHQLVRVHQWHYWHANVDRFKLFGQLLAARRSARDFF